jgi:hypothetical protein
VIHYPPARLRHNGDRPTAITNVLVATTGSSDTSEIPLGTPTCSMMMIWTVALSGRPAVPDRPRHR